MRVFIILALLITAFDCTAKTAEQLRAAYLIQIPAFVKYKEPLLKPEVYNYCFAKELGSVGNLLKSQQQQLAKRIKFTLTVVDDKNSEMLATCSYLYITEETEKLQSYIDNTPNSTLIIGENITAINSGSLIALIQERKKIKIHISRDALANSPITFSARLLGLAKMVSR